MRISVETGGFTSAADACRTGNQISALLCESLAGKLGGYAGMAGDDATSAEFAASYDDGARQALGTLAELTHAFIGLGRLLTASGANHRDAEAANGWSSGVETRPVVERSRDPCPLQRRLAPRGRLRPGLALRSAVLPRRQPCVARHGGVLDPRPGRGLRLARCGRRPAPRRRHGVASRGRCGGRPRGPLRHRRRLPRAPGLPRDPPRPRRARRAAVPGRRHRRRAQLDGDGLRGVRRRRARHPRPHPRPARRDRPDGRGGSRDLRHRRRAHRRLRRRAPPAPPRWHGSAHRHRGSTHCSSASGRPAPPRLVDSAPLATGSASYGLGSRSSPECRRATSGGR